MTADDRAQDDQVQDGQAMKAGYLYTVAGDGGLRFSGNGVPALGAGLGDILCAVRVDAAGNLVFADTYHNRIRVVAESSGLFYGRRMTTGDIYTVAERAKVQGYIASVWGIASFVGPTLGGVFSDYISWRWIFFVNVPLGLAAAWVLVRRFHENVAPKTSLVDYLAKIDVKPDQIKYVGISHYHADHTGQVSSFPKATLRLSCWHICSTTT